MQEREHTGGHPYRRLLSMSILSFVAMYTLMYSMVNALENVYPSLNQFYMAGVMATPMVIIELLVMRGMYTRKKLNALILAVSAFLFIAFYVAIRRQVAIGDRQFLKSMIPHHAGAILMCEQATIRDPGVKQLCDQIRSSQQREIAQMKQMLKER